MEYRLATSADMPAVADVFIAAFPESVSHTLGDAPVPRPLLDEAFRVCLDCEPDGFWVAVDDDAVVGYIIAPRAVDRVWQKAVSGGYVWRWLGGIVSGRYRFSWQTIRQAAGGKLAFWHSQKVAEDVPARILSVAVAPAGRGRHVATELVGLACDRFRRLGVSRVRLEVRPDNLPAKRVYERAGFRAIGTTSDAQGEWLIMVLDTKGD